MVPGICAGRAGDSDMKSDDKPNEQNALATPARFPVEEYALLVEGLDAAAIETACAQDGAAPGGVPPGWTSRPSRTKREPGSRLIQNCLDGSPYACAVAGPKANAEFCPLRPSHIVARGPDLAQLGIEDGDVFKILAESAAVEGSLVAMERPKCGLLIRRLRFIGGAPLLCLGANDRAAIPSDPDGLQALMVIEPAASASC